jgi:acetylornithine/LysW-gamma-L-lysine aminotransferase
MPDYNQLQQRYMVGTYVNRQLTLIKGEGIFLFDENNQQYLDLMSNYGVNIFGYNNPTITKALSDQLQKITTLHGSFGNDARAVASKELVKHGGAEYTQVYWSNSGAEAIEAALKFAVLATGKKKFIVCNHGYHGKTLGALSATSGEKYKKPFEPLLWEFIAIPYNDISSLEEAIDDTVAGFIVEPIQGEGGIYVPDNNYLQKVQSICKEKGILLIIDEIQSGMGRTGTFLASEGIAADMVCLGKGLAGGIPVGATIVNEKVGSKIPKHIHTSTFGGNPLACAGVIATLGLLTSDMLEHVNKTGKYFREQLSSLQSPLLLEVRGKGLMIGLAVITEKRNQLLKLLQDEHILVIPSGENVIRFLPPFIIQKEQVDKVIKALKTIINHLSS